MIPDNIKIGGLNYKIEFKDNIIHEGRTCTGLIENDNLVISLLSNRPQDRNYQTLLHEILHGIIYNRNLNIAETTEEFLVDELAYGLLEILKNNGYIK
jgi:hypothetical protein